jgi:hypothetical protein
VASVFSRTHANAGESIVRKAEYIKQAAQNKKGAKLDLVLEVLLDIRELLKKQNEMLRRGMVTKKGKQ